MGIKNFYNSGAGNLLIEDSKFPSEIHSYLLAEIKFLESIIDNFNTVIEVGCMHGRHLEWLLSKNKYYIGIDIAPNYINQAQKKAISLGLDINKFEFICQGVENLNLVIKQSKFACVNQENTLAFFPFNSFGNLEYLDNVINCLAKTKISLYISSYKTDTFSTKIRNQYYRNCNYTEIVNTNDVQGIRFQSQEGLNTIAYHPDWLLKRFIQNNMKIKIHDLSEIGIVYTFDGTSS